ncbi:unnamed protein product [Symbiodinium microadriaticum]|nr:unnamed protein product [Symbiodinium microadriaticum]
MLERLREFRSDLPELLYADEEHRHRVSVICPTTDERILFHPQLYDCFAAQTWKDKELVVIDTGPRSSPFLKAKALEDPRVIYRHQHDEGREWPVGLKRNLAIACASGATIAHFDDDDFYAPEYLTELIESMQGADAVTLASWFVGDACTGLVARAVPADDGSQESWILGYGFSYVYRRAAALRRPFQHEHFGEDYQFLVSLRDAPGGRGIRTVHDEQGLVLHMQQGLNLSNSHAHHELDAAGLARLAVAKLPGFHPPTRLLDLESPFISLGAAHRMFLRPPSFPGAETLRLALRRLGVARPRCVEKLCKRRWQEKEDAVVCYCVWRRKEVFMEPGRAFAPTPRLIGARLPSDVPRTAAAELRALRHVGRLLLTRCPATRSARSECEGWIRLQVHYSTHIALLATLVTLASLFPRVRLEVEFEEEAPQRQQELLAGSKCGRDLRV